MGKMKNDGKRTVAAGILLLIFFAVWTVLIQTVDVEVMGPEGTEVGLASVNLWFHKLTGVHFALYHVTDWLGLVPVFLCMVFGAVGLAQLIRRRSLWKVDKDLLLLGAYYGIVIAGYLLFEMVPVNYRPVLIEGRLEASYPSSTTLLVLSVMPTLAFQADRRIRHMLAKQTIKIFAAGFSVFMVAGRLISGVHWITDIIGAVLLSGGLYLVYEGVVTFIDENEIETGGMSWNFMKNFRN